MPGDEGSVGCSREGGTLPAYESVGLDGYAGLGWPAHRACELPPHPTHLRAEGRSPIFRRFLAPQRRGGLPGPPRARMDV